MEGESTAAMERLTVTLTVNGSSVRSETEARKLLVHFLREEAGCAGVRVGCDTASCGACTVLLDGRAIKSCNLFAVQADGRSVTTVEGLGDAESLHPVQQAFWDEHALQCGYCTSGFLMATIELLEHTPDPDDEEIRHALAGNLCRCTGYTNIVRAVRRLAAANRPREASR